MTISITDRLNSIEDDLNRIMEELQQSVTVEDASKHVAIMDSESQDILYRMKGIEDKIASLRSKCQLAYKRNKL